MPNLIGAGTSRFVRVFGILPGENAAAMATNLAVYLYGNKTLYLF